MAGSIATLWWIMFFTASALFVLVIALFGWAYRKPGFAANTSPRTWLLHAGVIMPSLLLAALATFAFVLGQRLVTRSEPNIVHVEALATRWAWHFRYPDLDAAPTASILHIPAGRTVEVRVMSEDVIHSFWVPRLAGKIDAIPGHQTRVQFVADRPGEYEGVCAEFCGIGHTDMRFRVIAHDESKFRTALSSAAP